MTYLSLNIPTTDFSYVYKDMYSNNIVVLLLTLKNDGSAVERVARATLVSVRDFLRTPLERMEGEGPERKEDAQQSSESTDGERSWARVVQGAPRGYSWTAHRISEDEITQLQNSCR